MKDNYRERICFIVSELGTAIAFLKEHIALLSKFYDVYLAGKFNDMELLEAKKQLDIVECESVPVFRGISIVNDIKGAWQLHKYFLKKRFAVVHSVTPKAGLLCAIAGKMAGITHRVHIFTGQVWYTKKGLLRWVLVLLDKLIVLLDTHILVDGQSQRCFLIEKGVLKKTNSSVLGRGSISGVNIDRFQPSKSTRQSLRIKNGVEGKIVFAFLGRLNNDKGIRELFEAFSVLYEGNKNVYLFLIGWDEENIIELALRLYNLQPGVNFTYYGPTPTPEEVLQLADVFCLPSFREGFGTSVLEASCLGIPVICSDTYGLMDAMIDNVTGLRHKTGDSKSLLGQMKRLAQDKSLRERMGESGRLNVYQNFSAASISQAWLDFYQGIV